MVFIPCVPEALSYYMAKRRAKQSGPRSFLRGWAATFYSWRLLARKVHTARIKNVWKMLNTEQCNCYIRGVLCFSHSDWHWSGENRYCETQRGNLRRISAHNRIYRGGFFFHLGPDPDSRDLVSTMSPPPGPISFIRLLFGEHLQPSRIDVLGTFWRVFRHIRSGEKNHAEHLRCICRKRPTYNKLDLVIYVFFFLRICTLTVDYSVFMVGKTIGKCRNSTKYYWPPAGFNNGVLRWRYRLPMTTSSIHFITIFLYNFIRFNLYIICMYNGFNICFLIFYKFILNFIHVKKKKKY